MSAAQPTGPVMSREEVDRALARLGAEYEAIESSLLALQDHAGRRLLEGAELTGLTQQRWAATEPAILLLWAHFDAYAAALRAARALRARHRWPTATELAELTDLLRGTGVTVAGSAIPDGARDPAEPARLSEQISLEQLVERMNSAYDLVISVVTAADAVWSTLPARIDLLTAEVQRVRSLADAVGIRSGEHPAADRLTLLGSELTALRAEVISDPLAFRKPAGRRPSHADRPDAGRCARAEQELAGIRREVETTAQVRDEAEQRLLRLRDVLGRADRTLAEARVARGEVLAKIAGSDVPAVSGPSAALHERLQAATAYRRAGEWHRLSPLLDALERQADEELERARASLSAVTTPLAVRAELRGRLDAYRAKSARHRVAEDPLLVERYDQARRLLWSAPCNLRAAEHAVLRFQQALGEALAPGSAGSAAARERVIRGGTPDGV